MLRITIVVDDTDVAFVDGFDEDDIVLGLVGIGTDEADLDRRGHSSTRGLSCAEKRGADPNQFWPRRRAGGPAG